MDLSPIIEQQRRFRATHISNNSHYGAGRFKPKDLSSAEYKGTWYSAVPLSIIFLTDLALTQVALFRSCNVLYWS